jgi:hypothetical protein
MTDEAIEALITELRAKVSERRALVARLGYKHQSIKGVYNAEAGAYEFCIKRLEEARGRNTP